MKVSIVIPTYKRPDYLNRLLESIEAQTFKQYEVIVVDDNSPNSHEYLQVINKYSPLIKEFKYIRNNTNKGAPFSRNRGILESKYNLVALVDDDDEWLPKKLEKQVSVFEKADKCLGIVYTWANTVNSRDEVIYKFRSTISGNGLKYILSECFIPSSSVLVRKDALLQAGLFSTRFPSCQDIDMWTEIFKEGFTCFSVPYVLTIVHNHNDDRIGNSINANLGYYLYYKKNILYLIRYIKFHLIVRFIIMIIKFK